MKKLSAVFPSVVWAVSCLMLTGCIDDNYDLSDIDTTVKVPVDNLVIPVNIDEVHLKNIMELSDGSVVKVIDGQYTMQYDGTFESSPIEIDPITMDAPNLSKSYSNIPTTGAAAILEQLGEIELPLPACGVSYTYNRTDVSPEIESLTDIGSVFTIKLNIGFENGNSYLSEVMFKDLKFQLPKGLTMASGEGQYDPETGVYTVADGKSNWQIQREVRFSACALNLAKAGIVFDNNVLSYSDKISILGGKVLIKRENLTVSPDRLPASIRFFHDVDLSNINVDWASGRIHYAIDDFEVPDVEITGLPDILSQDQTNIILGNPQIYLKLNNPVGIYNMWARTGLAITPWRGQTASAPCRLDDGSMVIPTTSMALDEITYCLAPENPGKYPEGYASPTFEKFTALSGVLSGAGLPDRLHVNLENPEIPSQMVNRLPIGRVIGTVRGAYLLNAPLNLKVGSSIVYTDEVDGWSSEDLDAVTITTLEVTAKVNTDIPLKVNCTGYPIDKNGKQINNVVIEGAEINANAKDQVITIRITGEIRNLDGIVFTARVDAENGDTLNENMTISLKEIRPRVSGYYQKEL